MKTAVVYRAFDAAGRLLYVGCTTNIDRRMIQHAFSSAWHPYMASLVVSDPHPYNMARGLEAVAIEEELPFFNNTKSEMGSLAHLTRHRVEAITEHQRAGLPFDEAVAAGEVDVRRAFPLAPTKDYIHSHYLAIVENERRDLQGVAA